MISAGGDAAVKIPLCKLESNGTIEMDDTARCTLECVISGLHKFNVKDDKCCCTIK